MNTSPDLSFAGHDQLFGRSLSLDALHAQAPAVFAPSADGERSARYTFILVDDNYLDRSYCLT